VAQAWLLNDAGSGECLLARLNLAVCGTHLVGEGEDTCAVVHACLKVASVLGAVGKLELQSSDGRDVVCPSGREVSVCVCEMQ
jgi:hypothetical protein